MRRCLVLCGAIAVFLVGPAFAGAPTHDENAKVIEGGFQTPEAMLHDVSRLLPPRIPLFAVTPSTVVEIAPCTAGPAVDPSVQLTSEEPCARLRRMTRPSASMQPSQSWQTGPALVRGLAYSSTCSTNAGSGPAIRAGTPTKAASHRRRPGSARTRQPSTERLHALAADRHVGRPADAADASCVGAAHRG